MYGQALREIQEAENKNCKYNLFPHDFVTMTLMRRRYEIWHKPSRSQNWGLRRLRGTFCREWTWIRFVTWILFHQALSWAARWNASKTEIINILIKTGSFDKFDIPKLSWRPRVDKKCNNNDSYQYLRCLIECYCLSLVTTPRVKMLWWYDATKVSSFRAIMQCLFMYDVNCQYILM